MESPNDLLLVSWRSFGDWGFKLVIIGVIGEVLAAIVEFISEKFFQKFFEKWKPRLRLIEIISVGVLIFGLAMEYKGHKEETHILDLDNATLNAKAGDAIERAANIESNNVALSLKVEELRSANITLELKLQPRRITAQQRDKFIELLKDSPKCPVKIIVGREDDETETFARQIRETLDAAGYGTGKDDDITRLPYLSSASPIGGVMDAPIEISFFGTNAEPINAESINWPGLKVIFDKTTKKVIVAALPNDVNGVPGLIINAFGKIGINPGVESNAASTSSFDLKPGEWCIFIPQKF
jgi:hypothetical protein